MVLTSGDAAGTGHRLEPELRRPGAREAAARGDRRARGARGGGCLGGAGGCLGRAGGRLGRAGGRLGRAGRRLGRGGRRRDGGGGRRGRCGCRLCGGGGRLGRGGRRLGGGGRHLGCGCRGWRRGAGVIGAGARADVGSALRRASARRALLALDLLPLLVLVVFREAASGLAGLWARLRVAFPGAEARPTLLLAFLGREDLALVLVLVLFRNAATHGVRLIAVIVLGEQANVTPQPVEAVEGVDRDRLAAWIDAE